MLTLSALEDRISVKPLIVKIRKRSAANSTKKLMGGETLLKPTARGLRDILCGRIMIGQLGSCKCM